jgi:Protein of unknown function (DUF3179)
MIRTASALLMLALALAASPQQRQLLDAGKGQRPFDVTIHAVPLSEIITGGPARDAIPALDHPKFVSGRDADQFLRPKDRILGVSMSGVAKAYPVKILNWHEIVNDEVGGCEITVTW